MSEEIRLHRYSAVLARIEEVHRITLLSETPYSQVVLMKKEALSLAKEKRALERYFRKRSEREEKKNR